MHMYDVEVLPTGEFRYRCSHCGSLIVSCCDLESVFHCMNTLVSHALAHLVQPGLTAPSDSGHPDNLPLKDREAPCEGQGTLAFIIPDVVLFAFR